MENVRKKKQMKNKTGGANCTYWTVAWKCLRQSMAVVNATLPIFIQKCRRKRNF